ncbi:hypothetical protein [Sinorhizobium meliloti]|nr:hypothetical protein [Sinorhizobium meliloti]
MDFYQVTKLINRHMVEVHEVSQIAADAGNELWMTGKVVSKLDAFTSELIGRAAKGNKYEVIAGSRRFAALTTRQAKPDRQRRTDPLQCPLGRRQGHGNFRCREHTARSHEHR